MTLADLPLETRCEAAIAVIWQDATLSIRGRLELVAAALWPTAIVPAGAAPVTEPAERWSTPGDRDEVRRRFRAGDTVSELADELGLPWRTVNEWCHSRG